MFTFLVYFSNISLRVWERLSIPPPYFRFLSLAGGGGAERLGRRARGRRGGGARAKYGGEGGQRRGERALETTECGA